MTQKISLITCDLLILLLPILATAQAEDQLTRAESGDAAAQYELGWRHEQGRGVPQDFSKALEWLSKSADQGHAPAQYYLGYMHEFGKGVPQDYNKANEYYEKAADQGYTPAQYRLGEAYFRDLGITQNYEKAIECFTKAAEIGSQRSQYSLGQMYYHRQGTVQNSIEAYIWCKLASEGNQEYLDDFKEIASVLSVVELQKPEELYQQRKEELHNRVPHE